MLTVTHIGEEGHESVHLAYEARFQPPKDEAQGPRPIGAHHGGEVVLACPVRNPGSVGTYDLHLCGGRVYVMNDTGKTVKTFELGFNKPTPAPDA